jgi:hypothetical protein
LSLPGRCEEGHGGERVRSFSSASLKGAYFDNILFTTIEALIDYIDVECGSWYDVPEDHPQHTIVAALNVLNPEFFVDVGGTASYTREELAFHLGED